MAGTSASNGDTASAPITRLRTIAENHLKEIDEEKQLEQAADAKRMEELQRYAKRRLKGKAAESVLPTSTPTLKLRSAQDVLNRLQWDPEFDVSEYTIGYLERFAGIKEMPATDWISETTEEQWIPQHRIKYFKRVNDSGDLEVVWDREKRIDRIFGGDLSTWDEVDLGSEDGGVRWMQ